MRSKSAITPEAFDTLLEWLDPDRDEAGKKYEVIRRGLVKMFVTRGCVEAENLADLTIDRVILKVDGIRKEYTGNPSYYFRGVGHNIYLEHVKSRREDLIEIDPVAEVPQNFGVEHECLKKCLCRLPENQKELILEYYLEIKSAKVEHRKTLAAELGIEVGTLRIRAHRIRTILERCVRKCLLLTK
jgi:DNA-directed RNA polymerase specialized sigma24 family protein